MVDKYKIIIEVDSNDNASEGLKKTNKEIDELGENSKQTSGKMDKLAGSLTQAGLAAAAFKIGEKVVELAALGAESRAATRVFQELAGGENEAAVGLAQLQRATSGTVDKLSLMHNASQLMLTGLAANTDEAARLSGVAVKLGTALGVDAADAMANLNSALLNNSFVRLDTLGISAEKVRERVKELKLEGLDMTQAFSQATLEQGELAIAKLGPAADASATSMAQLGVEFQNATQFLGEFLAEAGDVGAGLFLQVVEIRNITSGAAEQDRLAAFDQEAEAEALEAANEETAREAEFEGRGERIGTRTSTSSQINANAELLQAERDRIAEAEAMREASARRDIEINEEIAQAELVALEQIDARRSVASARSEALSQDQFLATARQSLAMQSQNALFEDGLRARALENQLIEDSIAATDRLFSEEQQRFEAQEGALAQLESFVSGSFLELGGIQIFDPDNLALVQQEAEKLQQNAEEIAALAEETDFEFIDQDQVNEAFDMADEAARLADEAERGATAFENMSLSNLLGEVSGGAFGELLDLVLSGIDDEDLKAEAADTFDLASGEATTLGQSVEDDIAPLISQIAEEFGPDAAADAASRVLDSIEAGRLEGLSEEEIIANATAAVGFEQVEGGEPEQEILIEAGDTLSGIAVKTGVSVDDLIEANEGSTLIVPGQVLSVGDDTKLVAIAEGEEEDTFAEDKAARIRAEEVGLDGGEDTGVIEEEEDGEGLVSDQDLENFVIVEDGLGGIEQLDFSPVLDPLVEDLDLILTQTDGVVASLTEISTGPWEATINLKILVEAPEILGANPSFFRAIEFSLARNGYELERLRN